MAERDCYWTGAVSSAISVAGNWADVNGDPLGGYPGEYVSDPGDPTYEDRVFLLGERAQRKMTTLGCDPPLLWLRGVQMDLAYATAYPGAHPNVNGAVLFGDVTVYGSGSVQGTSENQIDNLHLHGTSSIMGGQVADAFIYDGTHAVDPESILWGDLVITNIHLMDFDAVWSEGGGFMSSVHDDAQDAVIPALGDVRQEVTFGVGGSKTGTLLVPRRSC